MSVSRPRPRWWPVVMAGAAVAGAVILATSWAWAQTGDDGTNGGSLSDRATQTVTGKEIHYFYDVEEMTATSNLVIRGEVKGVKPGRHVGPPDDRLQVRDVTISVKEVLASRDGVRPETVTVDEWGWDDRGRGYQFKDVTWSKPGDQGYYFLKPVADAPGHYRLISSQGRVSIKGDNLRPSAGHHEEIYAEIAAFSKPRLERSVRTAFRDFKSGKVKPKPAFG